MNTYFLQKQRFIIVFALFFAFPSFAFAAPSFEISQCSEVSCTVVPSISVAPSANQTVTVRIGIKNPDQEKIYSVQSWIQYNPQVWEVVSMSDENSDFELAAPGEFKAKSDTGEIRIGRAVAGTPITAQNAIVADITLKSKKNPTLSLLSFIDFIGGNIGKTAIIGLNGNTPVNLLNTKPKDIKFNGNTGNTATTPTNTSTAGNAGSNIKNNTTVKNTAQHNTTAASGSLVQNQGKTETQLQNPAMNFINITRPEGLRSRTHEDGSIDHLWQMGKDNRITGYYLYYSTSSGIYMHRKDVGKTNAITFPAGFFEKGKRVYFAVQAYTAGKEVSDFSDETYLVVGTVGSESHPFFEQIFPNAVRIGEDENTRYYGTKEQKNQQADSFGTTGQKKPLTNTKSGIDIPAYMFFIFAGMAFITSRKLISYKT